MYSLDDPNKPELSLTDDKVLAPLPPEQVVRRAAKAAYALGDASRADVLNYAIASGDENIYRQQAASAETQAFESRKNAIISDMIQKNPKMSDKEVSVLSSMSRLDFQSNPVDVFERKFAERYTTEAALVNSQDPRSVGNKAMASDPEGANNTMSVWQQWMANREYTQKVIEDLTAEKDAQGIVSSGWELAKNLLPAVIPGSTYSNLVGIVPGLDPKLPGAHLDQLVTYFRSLPKERFTEEFTRAINVIRQSSVSDALLLAQSISQGQSSFESATADIGAIADVAGLGSLGVKAGIKLGAGGAVKIGEAAAEGAAKQLSTEEWQKLKKLNEMVTNEGRVVAVPHRLTPKELDAMREALNLPSEGRMLTPDEIGQMADMLRVPEPGKPGAVVGFEVNGNRFYDLRPDGSTVRRDRAGPSAFELQRADRTVFVTPEDAARLNKEPGGLRIVEHEDGTLTRSFRQDNRWAVDENATHVPFQTEPKEGLVPVELWNKQTKLGSNFYDVMATEGKITNLTRRLGEADARMLNPNEIKDMAQKLSGRSFTPKEIAEFNRRLSIWQDQQDFRQAIKDSILAGTKPGAKVEDMLAGAGDISRAGEVQAIKKLTGQSSPMDDIPSFANPEKFLGEGSAQSRAFAQRLGQEFTKKSGELETILKNALQVDRLTEQAIQVGIAMTKGRFLREYAGRFSDTPVNIIWKHIPHEQNVHGANVDQLVMRLGKFNGDGYSSRDIAEHYFNDVFKFNPGEAKIVQQGQSFFIDVTKTIDETDPLVRRELVDIVKNDERKTPESLFGMITKRVQSAAGMLSETQKNNRNIATHAPQTLTKELQAQATETAKALSGKERAEVARVLEHNRDFYDPVSGLRGQFYNNIADFEKDFQSLNGKLPSQNQIRHYFNYTRLSDWDWSFRNQALYRDWARLGVEEFQLRGMDGYFKGKLLDKFPWSGEDVGIWIDDGINPRFVYKFGNDGALDQTVKATVDDLVKNGAKIVQVAEPNVRPLKALNAPGMNDVEAPVHFVITNTSKRRELSYQQLNYQPGGHSIYMDSWYVKQPVLRPGRGGKLSYYGDNAVMNHSTEAEAKKYAEAMDEARKMLLNNNPNAAQYISRNLGMTYDDFKLMFDKGHLDLNTPIGHTYEGKSVFQTNPNLRRDLGDFKDATQNSYDLSNLMDKAFTADRNDILNSIDEKVMKITKARQLDPYSALERGLAQSVRNLWMNDYKVGAVTHWLEEYGPYLKPEFKTQQKAPLHFLFNPQWENTVPQEVRAAAEASRQSIVQFLGVQSEIGKDISRLQSKLMDSIYNTLGQGAANTMADWALPVIKDPAAYMRAIAFHSKLGLFNPVQMFVQANTFAHIIAVGGRDGLQGASAAPFMTYLRYAGTNQQAKLAAFDKMATKFGWKSGEFTEMYNTFQRTGLDEIGGEAALRHDMFDPQFFKSGTQRFLDKGTMFFNTTERAIREAAFATAFKEFRREAPGVLLDDRAIGQIMTRADTLSVNMTRASAANWQKGIFSVPTQFMAYNLRLAEQLLGKRLTTAEKARAVGLYATLYGVPTALGAATAVWPWYEDIKEEAMRRGVDFTAVHNKMLFDGILQTMEYFVTGQEHNVAKRYGPGGNTTLRDVWNGDKNVLDLTMGASGSIISDIMGTMKPLWNSVTARFSGKNIDYPVTWQDAINVLGNISTVDTAVKMYGMANFAQYRSKSGVLVADHMTGWDAALSLAGLRNMRVENAYTGLNAIKGIDKMQEPYEKMIQQDFARALSAAAAGDSKEYETYMKRVDYGLVLGGFQPYQRDQILKKLWQFKPSLEEKVPQDLIRKAPMDKYDAIYDTFFKKAQ